MIKTLKAIWDVILPFAMLYGLAWLAMEFVKFMTEIFS